MTQIGEINATDLGNYNSLLSSTGTYTPPLPELQPDSYEGSQKKKSKLPWIIGGLTLLGGLLVAWKRPQWLPKFLRRKAKDAGKEVQKTVQELKKEGKNIVNYKYAHARKSTGKAVAESREARFAAGKDRRKLIAEGKTPPKVKKAEASTGEAATTEAQKTGRRRVQRFNSPIQRAEAQSQREQAYLQKLAESTK